MNASPHYSPYTAPFRFIVGMLFVSAVLSFTFGAAYSFAQSSVTGDARLRASFQDLSRITGAIVSTNAQAKALCNQEKYLADCAQIGKRHSLFTAERIKQVDAVLEEFKGKAVEDLKKCQSAECLVSVASELSSRLTKSAPEVAKQLDLTAQKIEEKKAIVEAAKEIGVDAFGCRDMNPDTASLDMLRGCARLAKHERLRSILPEAARRAAELGDASIRLEESLQRKEYQCGDNTAEGCGSFCLHPTEATRAKSDSTVPPICRAIAERFFGAEGVRHLEAAYKGVKQTADAYAKRAEQVTFKTLDGKALTDPVAIGRYLEDEGKRGNVEAVEKGLDFMVAKGFAGPEDKEFALGMVRKVREQGGLPDFDACSQNVSLCSDFIPDEHKEEFTALQELESAMRQEMGFDPRQCQQGGDEDVARRCIEGSKRALGKLEALGTKAPAIAGIVSNIRQNVQRGEEFLSRKNEIQKTFAHEGGPGGCHSETDCRQYCSDPAHGPECIAFGAKNQISGFKGQEALERLQQFTDTLHGQEFNGEFQNFNGGFQQGPGEKKGPEQSGTKTQDQHMGAGGAFRSLPSECGPDRAGCPRGGFGTQEGAHSGPSPECSSAIQAGDFVKAKEVCRVRVAGGASPSAEQICPFVSHEPCAAGEYRKESRDQKGCALLGECVPIPSYNREARRICPALPTVDQCPAGQERVEMPGPPDCGTYYRCIPRGGGTGSGGGGEHILLTGRNPRHANRKGYVSHDANG